MKTTTIRATLPFPTDTESTVQNLRQASPGAPLRPVSQPTRLCEATGTPLASWTSTAGERYHIFQASTLALLAVAEWGGEPTELGSLPTAATAAVVATDAIHFFTPKGIYSLSAADLSRLVGGDAAAGGSLLASGAADCPAVAIAPTAMRTHTAYTKALTLTGSYPSWAGALTSADIALVGDAVVGALRSATAAATADGCAASPLLAWYRLRNAAGSVVFRSMPVVVTPDGIQGPAAVDLDVAVAGGSYSSVAATAVAVTGFKVGLSVDAALLTDDHRRVAMLELLMAPPIDLVDYGMQPYITRRESTATAGTLRVEVPRLSHHAAIVPALLDRLDEVSAVVATLPDPFNPAGPLATGSPYVAEIAADLAPQAAQSGLLAALARAPQAASRHSLLREASLPHSFTATVATAVGDITALADITPVHALPLPLSSLWITDTASVGPWSAKVCVSLLTADGQTEKLCSEASGSGPLPKAVLPLLAYPHSGAFCIDLEVTTPSLGTVARSFTLTPTPAGLAAYYCGPSLSPIALSDFAAAEPMRAVSERKPVRRADAVLIADAASPLAPVAATEIGGATVVAITEASRSSAGLSFGRNHLYAFTSVGIYAVSVSSTRGLAASLLAREAVTARAAVAVGRDGVYAATATGIVRVSGNRTVHLHPGLFAAIGYSPALDELWCLPAAAATKARPTIVDGEGRAYSRTDLLPTAFSRNSPTLLIATADGLYDASVEVADPGAQVAVAWQRRVCMAEEMVPRIRGLIALMAADSADIAVDLLGDNGSGQPHRFAGLALAGKVAAPPYLPVIARPHRYVTISLSGRLSPDATVTSFQLLMNKMLY